MGSGGVRGRARDTWDLRSPGARPEDSAGVRWPTGVTGHV